MAWTDQERAELRRRWEAAETAGTIGKAMGKPRNAVIGEAHRMDLHAGGKPPAAPPSPPTWHSEVNKDRTAAEDLAR